MKPKYLQAEVSTRDRWMVSYLDVLTVLLIFFVAIAAKSLQTAKAAEPPKSLPKPIEIVLPPPDPNPWRSSVQHKLEEYGLDWHAGPMGLVISLPQAVLFPAGKARINASAIPMVGQIAEVLQEIPNKISLAGHADPVPIHNLQFKSNWELAAARSLSLLNLLIDRYGLDESRFSIASYSSNVPRGPNDTPDGRAGNRRVEILILDQIQADEATHVDETPIAEAPAEPQGAK